jgi:hypothetical protein
MEADPGYHVEDVLVDGESVGAVSSYTFSSIIADHTISVSFTDTYTITPSAGSGGSISPDTIQSVYYGDTPSFTITADPDYLIYDVVVDGTISVKAELVDGVYTFPPVTTNHTIAATFYTTSCPDWDLNCDGYCNALDLSIFVSVWNATGEPGWIRSDWNKDGVVDALDFSGIFTAHWGETW